MAPTLEDVRRTANESAFIDGLEVDVEDELEEVLSYAYNLLEDEEEDFGPEDFAYFMKVGFLPAVREAQEIKQDFEDRFQEREEQKKILFDARSGFIFLISCTVVCLALVVFHGFSIWQFSLPSAAIAPLATEPIAAVAGIVYVVYGNKSS